MPGLHCSGDLQTCAGVAADERPGKAPRRRSGTLPAFLWKWKGRGGQLRGARESILIGFLERLTGEGKGSPEGSGRISSRSMCRNRKEGAEIMKQGIKGGQAPAETLTGGTLKEKESCNMCHIAGTDESKGHNRDSYSEYIERNFAYYPKW